MEEFKSERQKLGEEWNGYGTMGGDSHQSSGGGGNTLTDLQSVVSVCSVSSEQTSSHCQSAKLSSTLRIILRA